MSTMYQPSALNATKSPTAGGSADAQFWDGNTIKVSATANPGYTFVRWTWEAYSPSSMPVGQVHPALRAALDANIYNREFTASRPSYDPDRQEQYNNVGIKFTAHFSSSSDPVRYIRVTTSDDGNGSVMVGGYYEKLAADRYVLAKGLQSMRFTGSGVFTAIPNPGYEFDHWESGTYTSANNPQSLTWTHPAGYGDVNASIKAYFRKIDYTLTTRPDDPTHGSTEPTEATVHYGDRVTIKATANPGWEFDYWDDGSTDAVREVEITGNAEYVAYFKAAGEYHTVTLIALGTGTVAGSGTYDVGTRVECVATPGDGACWCYWESPDGRVLRKSNPYAFSMPAHDVVLYARFGNHRILYGKTNAIVYSAGGRILYSGETFTSEQPTTNED